MNKSKRGRPATGQGRVVSLYLNRARLEILGDDPVKAIYKLIDGVSYNPRPCVSAEIARAFNGAMHEAIKTASERVEAGASLTIPLPVPKSKPVKAVWVCARCRRVGVVAGCPACAELRKQKKQNAT